MPHKKFQAKIKRPSFFDAQPVVPQTGPKRNEILAKARNMLRKQFLDQITEIMKESPE